MQAQVESESRDDSSEAQNICVIKTKISRQHGHPEVVDLFSTGEAISVHEYTRLFIQVDTKPDTGEVHLSIGDYELNIHQVSEGCWEANEIAPFANQMGVAVITLVIDDEIFESRPINIYASKLTYENAVRYLGFLTKEAEDISSLCFSAAKLGSDSKSATYDLFTRKLESGINVVRFLIEHSQRFCLDPIFNQQATTTIEKYQQHTTIDKKGIDYLASNPHELKKSDPYHSQIKLQGRYFEIDNIARQVTSRHFDTYENRVLHYFLNSFENFLRQAKSQLAQTGNIKSDVMKVKENLYYSFDRLLSDTGLSVKIHETKIQKAMHMVRQAKHLFNARLPVNLKTNKPHFPEPTSRALMKGHYRQLFELARRFYRAEEPEWSGTSDFFGLRNLSKVFEIVSLYSILRALLNNGCKLQKVSYIDWSSDSESKRPSNDPFNYFEFVNKDGRNIELYYEPWLKPLTSGISSRTGLVDITHYRTTKNGRPICWRPDFLLKTGTAFQQYHVFDAKYSRLDLVNTRDTGSLSKCVNKYVMGTRVESQINGNRTVFMSTINSMHILHSDTTSNKYFSHTRPLFDLDKINDNQSIMDISGHPITGSIPLSPDKNELINKIIRLISNSSKQQ